MISNLKSGNPWYPTPVTLPTEWTADMWAFMFASEPDLFQSNVLWNIYIYQRSSFYEGMTFENLNKFDGIINLHVDYDTTKFQSNLTFFTI